MEDKRPKVLLTEDNPGDVRLIQEMLAEAGVPFDLECADRLSAGLEHLAEGGIALVLLDLGLPDSMGFDTFIRVHKQAPQVPIVLLTILSDEALGVKAVQEGAQDYLIKGQLDSNLLVRACRYAIERKRAEETLRESEEKYRSLFENMLNGFAYCKILVDENNQPIDFIYLEVDDIFEKLIGLRKEDVIGKKFTEVFPSIKESALDRISIYGKVALTGERTEFDIYFEPIEKWMTISAYSPEKGYFIAVFEDITERKRAEEQIRYQANLVENVSDAIISSDVNFNILSWNKGAETMYGWREDEVIGKSIVDVTKMEYPYDRMEEVMEQFFKTGYWKGEVIQKRKDGTILNALASVSLLKDSSGNPVGDVAINHDITEHKQAEEKERELQVLREVDGLRSQLLANISHELRTPLTSIKGFVSTLLRTDAQWSEEEQRDFLQTIDQESDRLTRIISDLLDMSRIEAKALKLDKDNYQISEILDSVSSSLASLTERHQLQVIVPPDLPPVFVDLMRIGQVLTNLVENAAKYSPEGSEITIETQLAGDQVIVSVTDRGQGIAPELLPRVFDRFYQAESIATGRKSGTGLGLSICQGILETHDGRIWVESKLGEGSKFSFSLSVGKGE